MVILMVSAFLVAWLPYAGFGLYNVLNPDSQVSFLLLLMNYFAVSTETRKFIFMS